MSRLIVVLLGLCLGSATERSVIAKQRPYGPANIIDVRQVKGGVEYVLLNQRCRFIGLLRSTSNRPPIAVGDSVRFATDDKTLYVVDRNGKTHRLLYLQQELMPPPPPVLCEIRYRITDPNGRTISGAVLQSAGLTPEILTDENGRGVLRLVKSSMSYLVRIAHPQFISRTLENANCGGSMAAAETSVILNPR